MIKVYEINKKLLQENFANPHNEEKRNWFYKTFTKEERAEIRKYYYNHMEEKWKIYFSLNGLTKYI